MDIEALLDKVMIDVYNQPQKSQKEYEDKWDDGEDDDDNKEYVYIKIKR